jgi:PIF1-like helicase
MLHATRVPRRRHERALLPTIVDAECGMPLDRESSPFCSPFFVPSPFYDASTICRCLLSFFCAFFEPLRSAARKIASSSSLLLLIRICLEYQVVSFFYSDSSFHSVVLFSYRGYSFSSSSPFRVPLYFLFTCYKGSFLIAFPHGFLTFVDSQAGTGKTFLVCTLCDTIRTFGLLALPTATAGYAAQLYHGGRTTHSAFKVHVLFSTFSHRLTSP